MKSRLISNKVINLPIASIVALVFIVLASIIYILITPKDTSATSVSEFKAGNIISDSVFYNKDTMSVKQIQSFLDKQIGSCDTWGTGIAREWGSNLSRKDFARSKGWHAPPYVCLNNYHENPNTKENSYTRGGGHFAGGISAAQIIYNASQQYNINPQVLLTMLRKESAGPLTNDNWPLQSQYTYSMGWGCPDSGPNYSANCNDSRAGFYNQMMTAAWQFNYYKENSNSYRYKIGWNDIQYAPDPACGTKRVNIENVATLSLYIYTPYTPNDASLRNYPGTAHCGSYGNRNFFMMFNNWFGSTHKPAVEIPESNIFIKDGVYKIKSVVNSNVNSLNYNTDTSKVQIGDPSKSWEIKRDNQGYYSIVDVATKKALDVAGGSKSAGASIQLWESNGSCNQKWAAISHSKGVLFASKCSGLVLDITGGLVNHGVNVQLYNRNNSNAQLWTLDSQEPAPYPNGDYAITTLSNLPLDVAGGSKRSGAAIQIYSRNNTPAQKWTLTRTSDGSYTIKNPASGKFLDVRNGSRAAGTPLQLWDGNNTCAQRWYISTEKSKSTLISSCNGFAIDVTGGRVSTASTPVQIFQSNNSNAQIWNVTSWEENLQNDNLNGTYEISTKGNLSLDVAGGSKRSGAAIQIYSRNNTPAQKWTLTRTSDGSYTIKNPASGKFLDVRNGSRAAGTPLQLWDGNNTCAQRWYIKPRQDRYIIQSACSNSAVDVSGGVFRGGTRVNIFPINNTDAQIWTLNKK